MVLMGWTKMGGHWAAGGSLFLVYVHMFTRSWATLKLGYCSYVLTQSSIVTVILLGELRLMDEIRK